MKIKFIICLLCLITVSCKNKNSNITGSSIGIVHEGISEILISEKEILETDRVVEDIDIIRLGEMPNNYIGAIDEILILEGDLVIVDKNRSKGIFLFDSKGNFIRQIGRTGKGKGEFLHISDVAIIPETNDVAVLDQQMAKINIYNKKGEFLESIPTKYGISMIQYLDVNNIVAFRIGRFAYGEEKNSKQSLLFLNKEMEVMNHSFDDSYPSALRVVNDKLYKMGNEIYYVPNFANAIFQIKSDTIKKIYDIQFKKNGIPSELLYDANIVHEEMVSNHCYFSGNFIELNDYMMIATSEEEGLVRNNLFDKKNNKLYYLSYATSSPLNDYFTSSRHYIAGNKVAGVGDPSMIMMNQKGMKKWLEMQDKEKLGTKKIKQLEMLIEDVSENDNPLLFIYTLKKEII